MFSGIVKYYVSELFELSSSELFGSVNINEFIEGGNILGCNQLTCLTFLVLHFRETNI